MRNGFRKTAGDGETMRGLGPERGASKNLKPGTSEEAGPQDDARAARQTGPAQALYSAEDVAELLYMLEEEKLAGDLYEAFFAQTGVKVFRNIARSEDKHFDALLRQADKIGLDTDRFVFAETGVFEDGDLQALYDELLAAGSASVTAALQVGVFIEETDIIDLAEASEAVAGTKLAEVYDRLLDGSLNHLEAFEGALGL